MKLIYSRLENMPHGSQLYIQTLCLYNESKRWWEKDENSGLDKYAPYEHSGRDLMIQSKEENFRQFYTIVGVDWTADKKLTLTINELELPYTKPIDKE